MGIGRAAMPSDDSDGSSAISLAHRTYLDHAATTSTELSLLVRARVRHDVGCGTHLLREAMTFCQQINGSSDMARGRSFERVWRDFSTSSNHAVLNLTTTAEVYGKILCGHDPSELSGLY